MYVNDIDINVNNALSIELTLFVDNTSILIMVKDIQDLIFILDRSNGINLTWLDKAD